jgi:hypothetical protein
LRERRWRRCFEHAGISERDVDYHTTHTTAASGSTAVVCDASGCHALETSTAQQESTTPTVVAAQTGK